jgi:hypothetical protein
MPHQAQSTSASITACLARASSFLAACSRPAQTIDGDSTAEQLSSSLSELVSAAEFFGCKPSFWRCAADAADLLGRAADAQTYRKRYMDSGAVAPGA